MKKLSIMLMLVMVMTLSATLTGFADNGGGNKTVSAKRVDEIQKNIDVNKGFVNKPKDFLLATVNDTVVISGDGKKGDKVIITLYKKSGDDYVQMGETVELTIGDLSVFSRAISLKDDSKAPKEASISRETLVVLELSRSGNSAYDYRLIKFSDDKEVKETLSRIVK